MITLKEQELKQIVGGINITGTIINSIVDAIKIALEVGRSLGTAVRRITSKGICVIK